jgi:hypothetical protein
MQINSVHLPTLAQFGIRREHLFDACVSQKVGAWVLADCIQRFGYTWKAVGCYYAGPASKNVAAQVEYVLDVQRFYEGYRRQAEQQSRHELGIARHAELGDIRKAFNRIGLIQGLCLDGGSAGRNQRQNGGEMECREFQGHSPRMPSNLVGELRDCCSACRR